MGWETFAQVFEGIGSGLSSLANAGGSIYSMFHGKQAYEDSRDDVSWQKRFAQREADLTRSREDTAIQRRMADLQAAGLHPALAAGEGAGTSMASAPGLAKAESPGWTPVRKSGAMMAALGVKQAQNEIYITEAQKELIEAQTRKTNAEADEVAANSVSRRNLNSATADLRTAQLQRERQFISQMPQMHEWQRQNAQYVMKQYEVLEHDLQYSIDHGIRTTDHWNMWTSMFSYLDRMSELLFGGIPENDRSARPPADSRDMLDRAYERRPTPPTNDPAEFERARQEYERELERFRRRNGMTTNNTERPHTGPIDHLGRPTDLQLTR